MPSLDEGTMMILTKETTDIAELPKKIRKSKSKIEVMLIMFFDQNGVVHYEFIPDDLTVNQNYYKQVSNRLYDLIR